MSATPARSYTRLAIAIVIAAVVVGAGVITSSYVATTTTETRTSTSTTTATETYPVTTTSTYIQTTTEFITTNLFQARTAVCQYGYTTISAATETETPTTTATTTTQTVTNTGPTQACTGPGAAQCGGVEIENASLTVSGTSPNPATSGSNLNLTIQNTGNYASTALSIILSNVTLLSTNFLWQPGSIATCSLYIPLSELAVTYGVTYPLAAETFSGTANHLSDDALALVYVTAG